MDNLKKALTKLKSKEKDKKIKGFKEGGEVVKEKIVAMDTSPNSGLITVKGFGASRRT